MSWQAWHDASIMTMTGQDMIDAPYRMVRTLILLA